MESKIILPGSMLVAEQLRRSLDAEFGADARVELRPGDESAYRGVDPTILVAVVSAVGGAASAFIAGLLRCAQQAKSDKIVIQKGDTRIEISPGTSEEDLERAAALLKTVDEEPGPTILFE